MSDDLSILDFPSIHNVWVTRGEEFIPIAEMSDQHLRNTLRMIRRWMDRAEWQYMGTWGLPPPRGEMAQDAYWREMDSFYGLDVALAVAASIPQFVSLSEEFHLRRLRL